MRYFFEILGQFFNRDKQRLSQRIFKSQGKQTCRRLLLENLEERTLLAVDAGLTPSFLAEPVSTEYIVTTLSDVVNDFDDVLSLREAILQAQDGGKITFDASLSGQTILLSGKELEINKAITIDASSLNQGIIINGVSASRVFNISIDAEHTAETPLCFNRLKIMGGNAEIGGGMIVSSGTLLLTDCVITGNRASDNGGGIYNQGEITLINSVISNNTAVNFGGGVYNGHGIIQLTDCVISENSSSCSGGGLYEQYGTYEITRCVITENNAAESGGGIGTLDGDIILTNCNISGNVTRGYGGGLYFCGGEITLINDTVSGNSSDVCGGGAFLEFFDECVLYNTIIALNYHGNVDGRFVHSTIADKICLAADPGFVTAPVFDDSGNLTNFDTLDLRLKKTSWLIDAGNNSLITENTDLAGKARIAGGAVDLGAYEYQGTIGSRENPSLIVTTEEDSFDAADHKTSLREAIFNAKQGETITFDAALSGKTFVLDGSEICITNGLTIDASNLTENITIDANQMSSVFYIISKTESAPVILSHLVITGGHSDTGGGIRNCQGTLIVKNGKLTENNSAYGAGIYNAGILTVTDTLIENNTCSGYFYSGGGIYSDNKCELTNCSILRNSAYLGGGVLNNGELTITNCIISENTSIAKGGGIYNQDKADLTNCLITRNSVVNSKGYGGGIYNDYRMTIKNCTIAENSVKTSLSYGGGICASGNGGCGLYIYNSIIAQNKSNSNTNDIFNIYNLNDSVYGYNCISSYTDWSNSSSCNNIVYNSSKTLFVDSENKNYTLCKNSQALDKGNNSYVSVQTDLAGKTRIYSCAVDLGAYEYHRGDNPELQTPQNIMTSAEGNDITITWDAVANANRYLLYYSTDPSNMKNYVISTRNSVTLINLDFTQQYYISVQAQNTLGTYEDSDMSAIDSPLTIALLNTSAVSGTLLTTTIYPLSAQPAYQWYRVNAQGVETRAAGKIGARYKVTEADKGYYLKVVVVTNGKTASAVTKSMVSLSTPEISLLKRKGTSLTFNWRTVDGADTYMVTYADNANFQNAVTVASSGNNIQIDDLALGATYYAKVQAFDSTETFNTSAISSVKSMKLDKLSMPEITSVKTVGSTVTVGWTLALGADRYVVQYSTNADFSGYKSKIIDSAETNSVTVANLTMGKIYYVRVQARSIANTYTSSEYSIRKITVNKLETPEITPLTVNDAHVLIKWNAVQNANRYIVMYSAQSDFTTVSKKIVDNALSAEISGLTAGNTYYFKVQARDKAGKFMTSNDSEVQDITFVLAQDKASLFDDEDEFDFFDDAEILAAFTDEMKVLDLF